MNGCQFFGWLAIHAVALACCGMQAVAQDSRGHDLSKWINQRGRIAWGEPPQRCDDLTFARRVFLDLLGRVPSVAELRDFEDLPGDRRAALVDQIVFAESERADDYSRLASTQLARHWQSILLPNAPAATVMDQGLGSWLSEQFATQVPFDMTMQKLVELEGPGATAYFSASGSSPVTYAGHISRSLLGVRIECAQCHDHPFTDWKQEDFWGMAAFYSTAAQGQPLPSPAADQQTNILSKIVTDGVEYPAKHLWSSDTVITDVASARKKLGEWLCSADNPQFSANAANRFWQYLVGRGIYADIENLDEASDAERAMLDELGEKFSESDFLVAPFIAAICKSDWYQAESNVPPIDLAEFYRPLKSVSANQIFDSMEQSLLLPISRVNPDAARWTGGRTQLVSRLGEAEGQTPEEFVSGIPQALAIMNGKITMDAVDFEKSKLLRAVVESPFFGQQDRIEVLYLAVLSRRPTPDESAAVKQFLAAQEDSRDTEPDDQTRAIGEVLWALLNSPEFVLCR